jgi:hypothetical protein
MPYRARTLSLVAVATLLASSAVFAETPSAPVVNPNPNAVLVLGGDSMKHNLKGSLGTSADGLTFETKKHSLKLSSTSLERISVGSDVRETGGLPVTAAKMAIPYGGGRVVSLFAHAKYDTLTVEYRDENGGYHGMLFNLPKGQADSLQSAIGQISAKPAAAPMASTSVKDANVGWAIQVEPLAAGDTDVSPEFLVATYEHLIEELTKSKHYSAVLRSGDSNASKYAHLIVLKTDVQKFVHGNEQARAVTTVKGWTKLGVKMHLQTPDGRSYFDKDVESNVRFYGNNIRATQTLAESMTNLADDAGFPKE